MRRVAPLLVLALLVGCSSSHDKKDTATPGTTTSPTTAASAAAGATPGASASTASSARPGASSSSGTSGSGAGTTGVRPGTSSAPAQPAKGTPSGTYTYDSSGSSTVNGSKQPVSGTSSLQVSEVIDGSQTTTLHNEQGDTTQELVVKDNGSFLSSLTVKSQAVNTEFDFSPPALLLGDPAKVGATWTWTGTSTDGKTTVKADNKVLRTETITIGGQRVPTVVLQTRLVITNTSQDLSFTADTTNWVDQALRLPVKTHTLGSGHYGTLVKFSSDTTDVMRSVHPG